MHDGGHHASLCRHAVHVAHRDAIAANLHDLTLLHGNHGGRAPEDGGDVGGKNRFALTEADDERGRYLHANQQVGLVAVLDSMPMN